MKNVEKIMALVLFLCLLPWPGAVVARSEPPAHSLKELEADYLYNLLLFIHWPGQQRERLTICVLDDEGMGTFLMPEANKPIKGSSQSMGVKFLTSNFKAGDLKFCSLLFISKKDGPDMKRILAKAKGLALLTVSDLPGFVEQGGMIGLVTRHGRLRWQINQTAAREAGLSFAAQILRNADMIVGREGK
ncbi:hypothetical protein MNBD_DELTA03-1880 [hydrothermal vent metagenome]|uniref:Transmembrane protein n=1 Tax=hydrothermal vent metagenome TaxID=652676 RepID=A0A3B0VH69_9ZZZZ